MAAPTAQQRGRWPSRLLLVRHGESAGNVARNATHAAGLSHIDIADRDADVSLSMLGEKQSSTLGKWLSQRSTDQRPGIVLSSPYRRARETAALIRKAGGLAPDAPSDVIDERLRSAMDTLSLHYPGQRVLIVTHEVVVMCLRYLIEELDEAQILAIGHQRDVANCSVTEYEYQDRGRTKDGSLILLRYSETAPPDREGAPVAAR